MHRHSIATNFWIFLWLCLLLIDAGVAADVDEVVAGLQKRYASVTTLSAQFEQTYRGPGIVQVESGTLWLKKPGLMRWEYRVPETKLFISNGRDTYLYTPEDRQVMVQSLGASEKLSTPLEFLLGEGNIAKSFTASWEVESYSKLEQTYLLRLAPRVAEQGYAYLVLEVDQKDYDLRRMVIREASGNTSEFLLANVMLNPKVDSRQFEFTIPKGVEVIRRDEN
jgi:outer membrane lipoprotein carrier protein